jgi:radical SAM superfamily enzyme YgiQ (UPF0313 family)
MKIALINPPYGHLVLRCGYCSSFSKSDYYWPPIDLMVQSGFLTRAGHEIKVFDFNIEGAAPQKAVSEVVAFSPEGMLMLVGSGSWKSDLAFAGELKKAMPGVRMLISGGVPLYNPKDFLASFPWVDGVLMDFTQDVAGRFLSGEKGLPHLSFRQGGEIVIGVPSTERILSYPPGRHDLFPLHLYRHPWKSAKFTVVLTSFGCPFSCSFCNAADLPFKQRPEDEIVEELKAIESLGIREVMFRDLNFVSSPKRTRELCGRIVKERLKIGWYACTRADTLDDETLALMKKAGCHTLQIGVESGSEETLKHYQKKVSLGRIEEAFRQCKKHGIRTLAFFIIGLPGETPESIRNTVEFSKRLKCDFASFNIAMPLYGTRLRQECIEQGLIASAGGLEELETSYQETTIETPLLSKDQILNAVNLAMRSFYLRPGYILRRLISVRDLSELKVLFRMGTPVLRRMIIR